VSALSQPIPSAPSSAQRSSHTQVLESGAGTQEPVLCQHCGRTASNGLVCVGMCVADSGY